MAKGIYRTLPEAELLLMRDEALQALRNLRQNITVTTTGGGGKNYGFATLSQANLHDELNEINFALQIVNPTTYGKRVTRTVNKFNHLDYTVA